MRLIVGVIILIITALDVRFGQTSMAFRIAGFTTGGLLLVSTLLDLLLPEDEANHSH
jgi:hypothetical protein